MLRDGRSIGLGALLKPATPKEEAAPAQQSPEQRYAHLLKVLATPPVVPTSTWSRRTAAHSPTLTAPFFT